MALGGHYYELFSTQAKRYITDDSSAEPSSAYDDKSDAGISGHGTQPDGKMPDTECRSRWQTESLQI